MKDITKIDWSAPFGKVSHIDPTKQKVFYVQNGVEYDAAGNCIDAKKVKDYYAKVAADAQAAADEAAAAARAAQEQADAMLKTAGITKAAAKKAAG